MAYESNIKYRRVHVANETIVTSGNNEDIDDLSHNPIGRDIKLRTTKSTLDTSDEMESTLSETNFTTELASILASALAQDVHDLMILFKHSGVGKAIFLVKLR
ncbi:hypothetical protein DPMN_032214 [Dreissena polymorpha]|uniref:Uncharacterized protein n=1 Tax=Dreissena polymorpha TaxID=45954 RepID=A0A9D4RJU3_DREPO|nr:hypothetical protein DPMN_032214 [Dreissena polymorpha]